MVSGKYRADSFGRLLGSERAGTARERNHEQRARGGAEETLARETANRSREKPQRPDRNFLTYSWLFINRKLR